MKIEIKNRWSTEVIFECEAESLKIGLQIAVSKKANLYGANLYGADLRGADLCGANLCGADLYGADLYGANLYGANLYGADLRGADLCGADLCGANLCGADLSGEKITKQPLFISGLRWLIVITDSKMKIGCELHDIDEWNEFDDRRILEMDGKAAITFWKEYKESIMTMANSHKVTPQQQGKDYGINR